MSFVKIESIRIGKRKVDIIADGESYRGIHPEAAVRYRLEKGEIERERFDALRELSAKLNAKEYLLNLIARGPRTEREARNKLREKGYPQSAVDYAVEFCLQYRYLSDEAYASFYYEANASIKGTYRIRRELQQKGIADALIDAATAGSEEDEQEACNAVFRKYCRGKDRSDPKFREKAIRHLAARGFSYEAAKEAIGMGDEDEPYRD